MILDRFVKSNDCRIWLWSSLVIAVIWNNCNQVNMKLLPGLCTVENKNFDGSKHIKSSPDFHFVFFIVIWLLLDTFPEICYLWLNPLTECRQTDLFVCLLRASRARRASRGVTRGSEAVASCSLWNAEVSDGSFKKVKSTLHTYSRTNTLPHCLTACMYFAVLLLYLMLPS